MRARSARRQRGRPSNADSRRSGPAGQPTPASAADAAQRRRGCSSSHAPTHTAATSANAAVARLTPPPRSCCTQPSRRLHAQLHQPARSSLTLLSRRLNGSFTLPAHCSHTAATQLQSRPDDAARRPYAAERSRRQQRGQPSRRPHAHSLRCTPLLTALPPFFAVHNAPTQPQRHRRAALTPLHAALAPPLNCSTPSCRPRTTREQAHPGMEWLAGRGRVGGAGGGTCMWSKERALNRRCADLG